jgi:hypothetical protein
MSGWSRRKRQYETFAPLGEEQGEEGFLDVFKSDSDIILDEKSVKVLLNVIENILT